MTEQLNSNNTGFTGGPVAKTLPANAGGFDPWASKGPRATGQLNLCAMPSPTLRACALRQAKPPQ